MAMVVVAYRFHALSWSQESSRGVTGWSSAHESVQELHFARERGAGNGGIVRRWKRFSKSVRIKVLHQLVQMEDLELSLAIYRSSVKLQNPRTHAHLAALVTKLEGEDEACNFILEYTSQVSLAEKVRLGCLLMESYAKHGLWDQVRSEFEELYELGEAASAYKALFEAEARLGDPFEAEKTLNRMKVDGFKPTPILYKTLLFSFGKAALYVKMQETLEAMMKGGGHKVDVVTFNMMLVAYGTHKRYKDMMKILETMQATRVKLTVISWNAVTNACPVVSSSEFHEAPLSCAKLCSKLEGNEEQELVQRLMSSPLPRGTTSWCEVSWKLNMHSMTVGTAYLILFRWFEDVKKRVGESVPGEVEVVTGWGKHSRVEGTSEVKNAITGFLRSVDSPFRVDGENKGRLIVSGRKLKDWLCMTTFNAGIAF